MYSFTGNVGKDTLGPVMWENVLALTIVYIICYFSMWKGVKTSGKVIYFIFFLKQKFKREAPNKKKHCIYRLFGLLPYSHT
jgi:hypothetical protein